MTKIAGSRARSGSISQRHGFADLDPDSYQNVMDPQHCLWVTHVYKLLYLVDTTFFTICGWGGGEGWGRSCGLILKDSASSKSWTWRIYQCLHLPKRLYTGRTTKPHIPSAAPFLRRRDSWFAFYELNFLLDQGLKRLGLTPTSDKAGANNLVSASDKSGSCGLNSEVASNWTKVMY